MLSSTFISADSPLGLLNPSDAAAQVSFTHILILRLVHCRRKHPCCPVTQMFMKSGTECLISEPPNRPEGTMILLLNCKTSSECGSS